MNKKITIPFAAAIALTACLFFLNAGCATPELAAYRTLGTTTVLVNAAMNGWGDYVRAGLATPDDQIRVRGAYEKYQASMRVAKSVALAMKDSGAINDPVWMQVVNAVTKSANDVINLIAKFVPSVKPITQ